MQKACTGVYVNATEFDLDTWTSQPSTGLIASNHNLPTNCHCKRKYMKQTGPMYSNWENMATQCTAPND